MSRAQRARDLMDRHIADRSSSPYDSVVEIFMDLTTDGEVDEDLEAGPEPGSLQDLMQ